MLIVYFLLGLIVLSFGADLFVRGASAIATRMGISPLIIGLTVVAFGTSAPEVAVVVQAGFQGQGDLGFGNIVGSNISNFLLILGIAALISPVVVTNRLIRTEMPLLLGVSALVYGLAYNGFLTTLEGFLLLGGAIAYTAYVVYDCRKDLKNNPPAPEPVPTGQQGGQSSESPPSRPSWGRNALFLLVGLAGLVLGSNWLVDGASGIARLFGVSELVIGLSLVAVGTSLPELATAVAAGLRGEKDMVIGNVIGSNLFNLMFVLGIGVVVVPEGLPVPPSSISFDLPVMLAVTAASLPIFLAGNNITRWEGGMFLVYYAAYILYLFLFSVEHDLLPAYSTFMLEYILPLTVLLLLFAIGRAWIAGQQQKRQRQAAGLDADPKKRSG
jgi:cation:H+ antiporter